MASVESIFPLAVDAGTICRATGRAIPYVLSISNKVFAGKELLSYKANILDLFLIIPVLFISSFLNVYLSESSVNSVLDRDWETLYLK